MKVVKNPHAGALPSTQPPADAPIQHIRCDRDQACDVAKFEITTPNGPVFLCGHHFHVNELFLLGTKYEVKRINA
jgi:hypothetical protein